MINIRFLNFSGAIVVCLKGISIVINNGLLFDWIVYP